MSEASLSSTATDWFPKLTYFMFSVGSKILTMAYITLSVEKISHKQPILAGYHCRRVGSFKFSQ